jgi:hypothetical protein
MDQMSRNVLFTPYVESFTPYVEINVLNLVDPDVANIDKNLQAKSNQIILKYGGMANGVGQMVSDIKRKAQPRGLKVLRIWSHGSSGGQGVSLSPNVNPVNPKGQRAGISMPNYPEVKPALDQLTPYFAPDGRVELRGCNVGAGYDGIGLVKALAELWQVDVYAAIYNQPIGPIGWQGPIVRVTRQGAVFPTSGIPIP